MFSNTEKETIEFGNKLAQTLKSGDIIALHGDLGSGKTTLAKGVIESLARISKREIQSPTFTYLNIYEANPFIYHFDLYRLKDSEAFIQLGFTDFLADEGICLIEWAERINSLLPAHTLHVTLSQDRKGRRKIHVYKS